MMNENSFPLFIIHHSAFIISSKDVSMKKKETNGVTSPKAWHSAMAADRLARAEHLRLPSGARILAVRPDPLEWILSGRIPQRLLGAALEAGTAFSGGGNREM